MGRVGMFEYMMANKRTGAVDSAFMYRPPVAEDHQLIQSVMVRQMRENGFAWGVRSEVLNAAIRLATESLLRPGSDWLTLVASPTGQPDEICGFAIYREKTVFHAYVKRAYRGLGAWKMLRQAIGIQPGDAIGVVLGDPSSLYLARMKYRVRHLPFLILEQLEPHAEKA